MTHLHIPDGLLPIWLWGPAVALVLVLLVLTGRAVDPRRIAYQGSLGAMMLAAMAVPLGPLDYHLSLAGPIGVLLGPAAAFQVLFIVSLVLAFLGHGGLTVVGLNTMVLAVAAVTAYASYRGLSRRFQPPIAMALGSAAGQALSGLAWLVVVTVALRAPQQPMSLASSAPRLEIVTAVVVAMWLVGMLVEAAVAFGIGRFLARVHPGLLPGRVVAEEAT